VQAEEREHMIGLDVLHHAVGALHGDAGEAAIAALDGRGDALDVAHASLCHELLHARHRGGRSLEFGPAMDVHDAGRLAREVDDPVERGVTAAEDHQALAVEVGRIAHAVVHMLVLESFRALDAEPAWLERSEASRNDHGLGDEPRARRGGEVETAVLAALQFDHLLAEVELGPNGLICSMSRSTSSWAPHTGRAGMS